MNAEKDESKNTLLLKFDLKAIWVIFVYVRTAPVS